MLASLQKLKGMLDRPAHAFRATSQTFSDLDVQRIAGGIQLVEKGRIRGTSDQPGSGETALDAVETEVLEVIGAAQKNANDELENQLAGFRQRLIDLDFEARFSGIKDVALSGLSDLKAEQQMGLDDLHGLRRDLKEAEQHQADFRKEHRLNRPSKINTRLGTTLKVMIIILIVIGELIANGYFLSRGDELGLVGGVVQAIVFSLLNVGVALLVGLMGLPFLTHRSFFAKLWGLLWLTFFLCWTAVLNLGLAHYREVGVKLINGAGLEVMTRLQTRPLTLDDFESWVLFSLGVLFAVVALIDGRSLRDAYPQYQEISDNVRSARERYVKMRRNRIQDLMDLREDYQTTVAELRSDLSKRRTEHEAIVAHRSRQLTLFNEHQTQLEKSANALLRAYRDSNTAARKTTAPARFNEPFQLKRIVIKISKENEWNSDALQSAIKDAQGDLERVMVTLGEQFDRTLRDYRELDELAPGT